MQRAIEASTTAAFTTGLARILWVAAIVALAGAVLTMILIRPRDFQGAPEQMRGSGEGAGNVPVPPTRVHTH